MAIAHSYSLYVLKPEKNFFFSKKIKWFFEIFVTAGLLISYECILCKKNSKLYNFLILSTKSVSKSVNNYISV